MILRTIFKSIWERKGRVLIIFTALFLAGIVISLMLHYYLAARRSFQVIFKSYGANIVVLPEGWGPSLGDEEIGISGRERKKWLDKNLIDSVEKEVSSLYLSPMLYSVGKIEGKSVVFVGVDFEKFKEVAPLWTVQGEIPSQENEALLGIKAYQEIEGRRKERFKLRISDRIYNFKITGYFSTGGAEDYQIFIPLRSAQRITGKENTVNFALGRLDLPWKKTGEVAQKMEEQIKGAEVRLLQGIIKGKKEGLEKIIQTMFWIAGILLINIILCIMVGLTDIVLERKKEIALFKTLGASNYQLLKITIGESVLLALAGSVIGYFLGLEIAKIISESSLEVKAGFNPFVFLVSVAGTSGIAFLSTFFPLRKTIHVEPAPVLRGE